MSAKYSFEKNCKYLTIKGHHYFAMLILFLGLDVYFCLSLNKHIDNYVSAMTASNSFWKEKLQMSETVQVGPV